IGKFLGPVTTGSEGFACLLRLLDGGNTWVKLSAPYESSRVGPPAYGDIAPLVKALASRHTERCLWASNWPHPNTVPTPDNAQLLAWALDLFGGTSVRQR